MSRQQERFKSRSKECQKNVKSRSKVGQNNVSTTKEFQKMVKRRSKNVKRRSRQQKEGQKKAKRMSKQRRKKKKKRSSIDSCSCCVSNQTLLTPSCHSKVCTPSFGSASSSSSEETASPNLVTPFFLFDTNVPGLPYRSPTLNPTNLELAQVREYENYLVRQKHLEV